MGVVTGVVAPCVAAVLLLSGCAGAEEPPSASGRSTGPVELVYQMDESPGASVMKDSGSARLHGTVGADVTTGVQSEATVGYRFPSVDPTTTTVRPGHLASIPDGPDLDPGREDYAVEIRYRTRQANGANLVQKGQAQSPGGQFKIQIPRGNPQCYYKGDQGKVGAGSAQKINDGRWHVLRCVRTSTSVELYVDGVLEKSHQGVVGVIDNELPMTIGGKPDCDMVEVECDYFGGDIDYLRISKG